VTVNGVAALKASLPPDARIDSVFSSEEVKAAMAKLEPAGTEQD
jgi:hypothetical protein